MWMADYNQFLQKVVFGITSCTKQLGHVSTNVKPAMLLAPSNISAQNTNLLEELFFFFDE